ncbi:MAG: zf-TFIIB domain-containing protein [Spirochaetales bacterium]|nr:zf-TFIIB domain-containing protein [Spirochaetales bacterium]
MNCQICNGILTPVKTNDVEILSCDQCKGFWIKRGDLNKLIMHKAGDLEFSSVDHHMHKDTHGILKCVFCDDQAMIKTNFIGYSDIVLDFCEGCGAFWVDPGEAEKMQEYMNKIEKSGKKQTIIEIIYNILYSLPKV